MFKNSSYKTLKDFKGFFIFLLYANNDFLSFSTFLKLVNYLPDDIAEFWYNYLKHSTLEQKWLDFIKNELATLLKPNGKILVDYRPNSGGLIQQLDLLFSDTELEYQDIKIPNIYRTDTVAILNRQKKKEVNFN